MRELAKDIIDNFPTPLGIGRPMLGIEPATLLMECVAETTGDYIEIGSAVGGSAIMASMAMKKVNRSGYIFCIDPFGGSNELEGTDIRYQAFWLNILHYKLQQRVIAFKQMHPPWPLSMHFHQFSVGLIDGDHNGDGPGRDAAALDNRVLNYLLFDNAENKYVSDTVDRLLDAGKWEEYKSAEYASLIGKKCAYEKDKIVKFVALRKKDA